MDYKQVLLVSAALMALAPRAACAQEKSQGQLPAAGSAQPDGQAETASAPPQSGAAPAPAGQEGVGDIVVTANRRSENLQNVPITITAFEGEKLVTLGIQSTNDLPQITPGLSQTRTLAGISAFLRGVGTNNAGYSTEVPVATYLDGLYLPNSAASTFSFNNIERIEVLKGPQGTLYGRNTTGGLIHVITREPERETSIDASASYANYDTVQLNFYGSTPITDTLAANFAAVYINQEDGWGRNILSGRDVYTLKDYGFQAKLLWQPGPDTKLTLRGFFDRTTTSQGNASFIYPGSIGADGSVFISRYDIKARVEPSITQRQYAISLKAEQDLGFANLTSITGYINNRSQGLSVQTANFGLPVNGQGAIFLGGCAAGNVCAYQQAKTFSEELQLASASSDSAFSWIVGAFYYHDDTNIASNVFGTCVGTVCATPVPTRTNGFQYTRSISGYADGTYSITPSTKVTLGLRYTSDNKILDGLVTPLAGYPNSVTALPPTTITRPQQAGFDTDVTFNKLTYRAVILQEVAPDVNVCASYNRGFKSGTFNPTSFINVAARPEVLDAFEIGFKSRTSNRVLQFNASAFYYDYKDIQLRTTAPPAPPGSTILFNAAKARIKGIDVDAVLAPASGLTFNGSMEILDARYVSFPAGVCSTPRIPNGTTILGGYSSTTCSLAGRRLPSAPKFSYTLGATYNFDTPIGNFELTGSDGYKSHYFWEPNNRLRQNSFHVVNAAITWAPPGSRFTVQAFGRNLTDSFYFASAGDGSGGNDTYLAAAPRTYGIKARYRF